MVNLRPDNPMNKALMGLLICEVIAFGLALPGMLLVTRSALVPSVVMTVVACLAAVVAAGTLRRPSGFAVGWLAQLLGIALGLLTPMMYFVGGLFAAIWVAGFILGRRIQTTGRPPLE